MSSVPAGKRSWKCPECGGEVLLSVAQLDPIACDACMVKMRSGGRSAGTSGVENAIAGPLGMWSGLPETTKLGVVAGALIVGLIIGFVAGQATAPKPVVSHRGMTHSNESVPSSTTSSDDDSETEHEKGKRPEPPGPGFKWVAPRKRSDGSIRAGHWIEDPHYLGGESSGKKSK